MSDQNPNRRRYFRIDDDISLRVKPISEEALAKRLAHPSCHDTLAGMPARLLMQRERHLTLRRQMQARQPTIAAYIELLESQIDILARALDAHNDDMPELPEQRANISAQGIRFTHGRILDEGAALEVHIKLYPEGVRVLAYGHVVKCAPDGEHFDVIVDFTHIDEDNRELLVKHINTRQLDSLHPEDDD